MQTPFSGKGYFLAKGCDFSPQAPPACLYQSQNAPPEVLAGHWSKISFRRQPAAALPEPPTLDKASRLHEASNSE